MLSVLTWTLSVFDAFPPSSTGEGTDSISSNIEPRLMEILSDKRHASGKKIAVKLN